MQVQFLNSISSFSLNSKTNKTKIHNNSSSYVSGLQNDTFVRSNNISFKADSAKKADNDVVYDLAAIGVVGVPLLLSIAAATYLAKHQQPEDLFTYDGMYIGNVNDFKVKTDKIDADGDDGIFKVKDTGINIDASKYDIADIEKGIYKNYDGSVDIDLLHNKYIDKINGIFIDPDNKISAVKIDDELVNIQLPSFGSGYSMVPWDNWDASCPPEPVTYTRSEYKDFYHENPEDRESIPDYMTIKPDRTIGERIQDFFSGKSDEKYDIFGRRFFEFKDTEGHVQKIALDDESYAIIKEFKIDGDSIPALAKLIDNLKLEQYITHNYPEYRDLIQPAFSNVEEFLKGISHSRENATETLTDHVGSDVHTHISESLNENITDTHSDGIFDSIKSLFHQIF